MSKRSQRSIATLSDAASPDLRRLVASGTVLLQTRKRDGTWVGAPVSLVGDGDHAYFRSWSTAGKAKRLRNFSAVRLAPSSLTGTPTGGEVDGRAHQVHGEEERRARDLLSARFPVLHRHLVPWLHRRKGRTTVHYVLAVPGERNDDGR
ncbi:PPOX class F420-dependent oxidoreductase [Ruania zhangjianzhongii]|uniref:PPOX class F420-dependent oxidoreductase n=1 Tax=Ruania zhangjianzhongii TaxID=2603206 RepID=UPI00143D4E71|nr:PPOX class F420-dependent oxidoreductase [Ruania zhangjianzhongii]